MKKNVKKLVLSRETLGGLTGAGQEKIVLARSENSWCPSCESCTGACCPPYEF